MTSLLATLIAELDQELAWANEDLSTATVKGDDLLRSAIQLTRACRRLHCADDNQKTVNRLACLGMIAAIVAREQAEE